MTEENYTETIIKLDIKIKEKELEKIEIDIEQEKEWSNYVNELKKKRIELVNAKIGYFKMLEREKIPPVIGHEKEID